MSVLVREVIEIPGLKAGQKSITLYYLEHKPIRVTMDLERIEQVLVNLIENAVKFSNSDSRIELDARVQDPRVKVTVAESGPKARKAAAALFAFFCLLGPQQPES